ncbi:MAG: ThiF family adenylyltransferase [Tannerellaceae bacterium]|nr:ThiF family adenylyltransferase [Tannerellaceae bacterium]
MEERYIRNRIYILEDEQQLIKEAKILLAGAGIGSIIAECALRFGFEHITIVDGDKIEMSNLNRQNYTENDIGRYKAEVLAHRLSLINPRATIISHSCFIDKENVERIIEGHQIAVNALDFNSGIPFIFDEICKKYNIPVLHPYNLGWAGMLTVVKPDSISLSQLSEEYHNFELRMAEYILRYGRFWNEPQEWLEKIVSEYKNEEEALPPPQLSIASWIIAGYSVNAMYNLVTKKDLKTFPKFYLSSILDDHN